MENTMVKSAVVISGRSIKFISLVFVIPFSKPQVFLLVFQIVIN